MPNFHEHFITTSLQPYAEYEYRATRSLSITAGIKVSQYGMNLNQYADNRKTVGSLGGLPRVHHEANYRSWSPSADARYKLRSYWTVYSQFATGSVIPPSSVFDTKGALVAVVPKPTTTKTYQAGSVTKFNHWTLDVDAYYNHFQNPCSSFIDSATGESYFYQTGPSNSKGIDADSNVLIGHGLSLYLNGTVTSAKFQECKSYPSGLWIPSTPKNTEDVGFTDQ